MTENQAERIRNKIKKIKAALAADKKYWGGYYHDGSGLRYLPLQHYIKLEDYTGGLRYINWFNKNFPDDGCHPDFLFECSVILFKTGRLKEAEKKAIETFCDNTYIFDKLFGLSFTEIKKWESSLMASKDYAIKHFSYSGKEDHLADFIQWLEKITTTDKFVSFCSEFISIMQALKTEEEPKKRKALLDEERKITEEY
jgi:hypothetical protein